MKTLKPEDKLLLKEILKTPASDLLRAVLEEDKKEKKWLIDSVEFYKNLYKNDLKLPLKEIINDLQDELEEVNGRIERLKKVMNG